MIYRRRRKLFGLLAVLLATIAGLAVLHSKVRASAAPTLATKITYTVTETMKDTNVTTVTETGTYFISVDGRVRWEAATPKHPIPKIQITNFRDNKRFELDLQKKTATSNPMQIASAPPPQDYKVGNAQIHSNGNRDLGTKLVGGLLLRGAKQDVSLSPAGKPTNFVSHETWIYNVGVNSTSILVLEHRFESSVNVTDRRITNVEQISVESSFFEIPDGFDVFAGMR